MHNEQPRVILVDVSDHTREVLVHRLRSQGYAVEASDDPATGANMALSSPPAAVVADLWMPSISGVQLCRLLKAEPATAEVPVLLRGDDDDPRSRFWAERAGAVAYVRKGRMGDLVRALGKAVAHRPAADSFFMQLSGGSLDVRDRIARHLDAALFDSVIAAEVRSLASCGSMDRLFDLFTQFLSQVVPYRWLALHAREPEWLGLHHHPGTQESAMAAVRQALGLPETVGTFRVTDEDARAEAEGPSPLILPVHFGGLQLGRLALAPAAGAEDATGPVFELVARELGGPLRMTWLMEEQRRLATIDPLTGLRNRRSFLEQAPLEMGRSSRLQKPMCLLLMDVDHFKKVNDLHGHAGGDQVLTEMAALLRSQLRSTDLSARWGGEEFVMALPCTDAIEGRKVAERVREAIERRVIEHAGLTIPVTASIGLAVMRPDEPLEELIARADLAMYAAKQQGRNRLVVAEHDGSAVTPAPGGPHPAALELS